jgi:hypothetical protein
MPLSTFLNGRNPDRLRGLQFLSLSELGYPRALTSTSDSGGGATQTWTNGGTLACRIDPLTNNSRVTGGAIDERSTHVVTVPSGSTVPSSGQFTILNRGTYEVTATRDRTAAPTVQFEVIQLF